MVSVQSNASLQEAIFDTTFSVMLLAALIAALDRAQSLENTSKAKVAGVSNKYNNRFAEIQESLCRCLHSLLSSSSSQVQLYHGGFSRSPKNVRELWNLRKKDQDDMN